MSHDCAQLATILTCAIAIGTGSVLLGNVFTEWWRESRLCSQCRRDKRLRLPMARRTGHCWTMVGDNEDDDHDDPASTSC